MNIIHKKTCVIVICVIIAIISLALTLIINRLHKNQIIIVKSKSWFIDYEVNGDQVLIKCYITIKNTYKEEKKIRVFAKLPDEVVIGLLKNETVYVFDDNLVEKNYILPPQSINSFQVVFVGEYGGVYQKKINTFQIYLLKRLNRVLDCVEKKALGVYYSMPWERSADLFGGVKRTTVYLPYIDAISYLYLANVKLSPYPDYFYGGSIHLP